MSERAPRLTAGAVDLLLELLEQPRPVLSAAAAGLAEGAAALLGSGLLGPNGDEAVFAHPDDGGDAPVSLFPVGDGGAMAYYSPGDGVVAVPGDLLALHRVRVPRVLSLLAGHLDLPRDASPAELLPGLLWELGTARLPGRRSRVAVWFGRRLWDRRTLEAVVAAARARPRPPLCVLLTPGRADRLHSVSVPGAAVVPVRDVLGAHDRLEVDPAILGTRLGEPRAAGGEAGPIVLSPDGTRLAINGEFVAGFRSQTQIDALRKLVAASHSGTRLRAVELTPHGNLSRLFGKQKWELLRPHLRSVGGLWGFEV